MSGLSGIHQLLKDTNQRPNLLIIITDQEREIQHWPQDIHLPARQKLQRHGITFQRFYCNACMCSPSRATLLTSQFPSVTGVLTTASPQPKVALPVEMDNLATLLKPFGYHCEWHGKCTECVTIHRYFKDHIPNCFQQIFNDRIKAVTAIGEMTAVEKEKIPHEYWEYVREQDKKNKQ